LVEVEPDFPMQFIRTKALDQLRSITLATGRLDPGSAGFVPLKPDVSRVFYGFNGPAKRDAAAFTG